MESRLHTPDLSPARYPTTQARQSTAEKDRSRSSTPRVLPLACLICSVARMLSQIAYERLPALPAQTRPRAFVTGRLCRYLRVQNRVPQTPLQTRAVSRAPHAWFGSRSLCLTSVSSREKCRRRVCEKRKAP